MPGVSVGQKKGRDVGGPIQAATRSLRRQLRLRTIVIGFVGAEVFVFALLHLSNRF